MEHKIEVGFFDDGANKTNEEIKAKINEKMKKDAAKAALDTKIKNAIKSAFEDYVQNDLVIMPTTAGSPQDRADALLTRLKTATDDMNSLVSVNIEKLADVITDKVNFENGTMAGGGKSGYKYNPKALLVGRKSSTSSAASSSGSKGGSGSASGSVKNSVSSSSRPASAASAASASTGKKSGTGGAANKKQQQKKK